MCGRGVGGNTCVWVVIHVCVCVWVVIHVCVGGGVEIHVCVCAWRGL